MPNDSAQEVTRSFSPDHDSSSFQRPRSAMNEGYGFKSFASVALVSSNSHCYLKDDTLLIRVRFDPETLHRGRIFEQEEHSSLESVPFI